MKRFSIDIPAPSVPAQPEQAGVLRVGAAQTPLPMPLGTAMAGYSSEGHKAKGVLAPLFARAIVLDDGDGGRAAIVVADLMSCSRYLAAKVASETALLGIGRPQLFLMGTHTHNAPGHFYGNTLYDRFAQKRPGFKRDLANEMADAISLAVASAVADLQPALAGWGQSVLWGWSNQASPTAFGRNREADRWHDGGHPGATVPQELAGQEKRAAVDPRVDALTFISRDSGHHIAVLATFACHPTAGGLGCKQYSADWPGAVAHQMATQLARPDPSFAGGSGSDGMKKPVVAVSVGASGDLNALRDDLPQGPELVESQARHVAGAVLDAISGGSLEVLDSEPVTVDARMLRWNRLSSRSVPRPGEPVEWIPETELADFTFGTAALGGGEEARSWLHKVGLVKEGQTSTHFPPEHPQYPKARALGPLQSGVKKLLKLAPSPILSVQSLQIGPWLLAGMPGEPTIVTAWRCEQALLELSGARRVRVFGHVGDYIGYVTTAEEYEAQQYEGASTIFGRYTANHLQERLEQLMRRQSPREDGWTEHFEV